MYLSRILPCLECEDIFYDNLCVFCLNVGEGVCFILLCIDVVRVLLACGYVIIILILLRNTCSEQEVWNQKNSRF
jgi:hypothetical protein